MPTPVIRRMASKLADEHFGPDRSEGFAAVVAVQPTHQRDLTAFLRGELARLNRRISDACNRQHQLVLHGHSRLLDLERRLHLLKLLADYPDLATTDQGSREALETLVFPLLVEIHGVVQHAAQQLGDPTAIDLLDELEQRLAWGGRAD